MRLWHIRRSFSGEHGGDAGLTAAADDFRGVFQPKQLCDSMKRNVRHIQQPWAVSVLWDEKLHHPVTENKWDMQNGAPTALALSLLNWHLQFTKNTAWHNDTLFYTF